VIIYSLSVLRFVLLLVIALAAGACAPGNPLTVKSVQLGRSINSDDSVGSITNRFKPGETVYVAALTDGPGTSTITARWYFQGRMMSEESKDVSYREPAATEFHVQYAGGFPPGDYRVELLVDGMPVETRNFTIAQ
jgi:hypothetical protein